MKNTKQIVPANPSSCCRRKSGCWRRLLAAGLTLGLAFLFQSARSQPALVGEWLAGATNFADVSGYTPPGTHDGYIVGAGDYVFTNDVPPGYSGQSLFFYNGDTGLAISNSSILDANYKDTFDNQINGAFTVSFWAKGWPTVWSPWVSKWGDFANYPDYSSTSGWQFRSYGNGPFACFTLRDLNVGLPSYDSDGGDDMEPTNTAFATEDGNWHFYAGTFDGGTGVRDLYVDGALAAQNTNDVPYVLAAAEHLCIGAKDQPPGNNFGSFSTFEIYDVRVFNSAPPFIAQVPITWQVISGANGDNLVLSWHLGSLFQATNLAGPWTMTGFVTNLIGYQTGVPSPYTNNVTVAPQMFYKAIYSTQPPGPRPAIRSQ